MWKVVIIDDEEHVVRGLKKITSWKALGCECVGEAANGRRGLDIVRETSPHIVLTDIYMPIMNGLDMIQILREDGFDGEVVILSGYSEFEHARKAMQLNITDYLSKPASVDTIETVLKRVINKLEEKQRQQGYLQELTNKVKRYEPLVETEWMKSLLTGRLRNGEIPEEFLVKITKWKDQQHIACSLTYDGPQNKELKPADWYLFRYSVHKMIREVLNGYPIDFRYLEMDAYRSALCLHVNKSVSEPVLSCMLKEIKDQVEQGIYSSFNVKTTVHYGRVKENWTDLSESFHEACMKSQSFPLGNPYEDGTRATFPMESSQKLYDAIRYADATRAKEVLEEAVGVLGEVPYSTLVGYKVGIEIWTIITYSLYDIGIFIQEMFDEDFDLAQHLTKQGNWQEWIRFLCEQIEHICYHQQWDENIKHKQLIEQVMIYIEKHLAENITLQDIADELYISRNYLGQIFKKVVGESFKNYVTRLRMEKAKKMIQEGNFLIYEVSEKVGYVNPAYFTTMFKKYTGYTPRDLIQKR
ncbi:response regulator transcription factor [Halalkalibacterium halodurans]|jgi:two-component system response regulator YesN|uniref:response regulator transcription factor n=1 Tax=Halalkalibacterium halodurans TaxID=86665 RepID=UPI001067C9DA|nr:response regulator transcription factor [Halalkalibacterium halodurans]TES57947.1 response regulator transcription factor [Halalkalibacterium halodurans]